MAQRFCAIFDKYDYVVGPSGSCVSMVRNHYPSLIGKQSVCERTFELCEFVVGKLGKEQFGAKLNGRAALHIGCHERRELRAADAVHRLMSHVEGLSVVPTESDEWCCGFGGTFSVKFPELSVAMGKRKLAPMTEANLDYLISTDSSCLMHLRGLLARTGVHRPRSMHIAEVLVTALGEP
jgi:L-lactate dehydrogenase complex protein LldE